MKYIYDNTHKKTEKLPQNLIQKQTGPPKIGEFHFLKHDMETSEKLVLGYLKKSSH